MNSPTQDHGNAPVTASSQRAASVGQPTIVIQQSGSWIWRIAAFLGWAGFMVVSLIALGQFVAFVGYFDNSQGITERYHSGEMFATNKVAILYVEGLIANGEGFVKGQIDRIREDDSVKAIVVRVNSPGGTVTASDYMFHHLSKVRKDRKIPLVVSMGSIAASGGYYVAMAVGDQEQSIYAEPTTTTGSIGVMLPHYDISGLMARFDVKDDSLVTHPRKGMGAMTLPMSDDHRQLLQSYIDESFARFKDVIKEGRPKFKADPAALDTLATGEIFSGPRAKENGLVDEIGFLEDAIERAIKLAGLSANEVRIIEYERPVSLFDLGGLAQSTSRGAKTEWEMMLEFSAPRPYYLASTLPPILSTYASRVLLGE